MAWPQRRMAVPTTTRTQAHPFNDCPEVYVSKCERESHTENKRLKEKLNMRSSAERDGVQYFL
jgi:hypothetical protein